MPKVPASQGSNVLPFPQKPPEEVYIAMAAAQMNMQGKLFEPDLKYLKVGETGSPAAVNKSLRQDGNTKDQAREKTQDMMKKEGYNLEDVPGS